MPSISVRYADEPQGRILASATEHMKSLREQIARCDREIAEALKQHDAPAWLVTLGVEDWEAEKRLLLSGGQEIPGPADKR